MSISFPTTTSPVVARSDMAFRFTRRSLMRSRSAPETDLPRHPGHEAHSADLVDAVCRRLKVPVECRDLALLVARHHGTVHRAVEMTPASLVRLLETTDALRRPERFEQLLEACICDFHGRLGWREVPYPAAERLRQAQHAIRGVDAAAIAAACAQPLEIAARLHQARVAAVKAMIVGE